MDFRELWELIRTDLARARETLPDAAAEQSTIQQYDEFCAHNELELACDRLEGYADDHEVSQEFWLALRDAAEKMQLEDMARRYASRANCD